LLSLVLLEFKYNEKMKLSSSIEASKINQIAIIGTGPLSMLKALLLAKNDPLCSITLIDRASQVGGAWYSDRSPKNHEIECGCHIWSYVPTAYRYIEKELGIKLYPMRPNPVFVGNRVHVPYSIKNTVDSYKALLKITFGLKWKRFKSLKSNPDINFRFIGKKNKYPKTGSPELIHALEKKISANSNISVLLNTTIEIIEIDERIKLNTKSDFLEFDKLYLTYVSEVGSLKIFGKQIDIKPRQVDYIHFLVGFNQPLSKKISYWRLMNDPIVHRITDISYQTNFEEDLVLVGIKGDAYKANSEEQIMNHITELFKKYKLIDDTVKTEKIKTHFFPTHYLDETSIEQLKKSSDKIDLLHTTDLMHGFHFLLEGLSSKK